ncbi:hypothetical protein H6G64_09125 [Calothrix sp. FACHB-156]|nr:hypothetical protein [Nostoc linckia FACHB-104]MBD2337151.1 hypothetical protein [Calothrix sp. FACHB-156]
MSVKWKLFLILILGMFATTGAGVYIFQNQQFATSVDISHEQTQQVAATQISQNLATEPERIHYKTIPLESINSNLQGSDPATLALNAFEETASDVGTRKVEVVYPQRNQALVTITQISHSDNLVGAVKYRFEMATFGRSLLVSSPPVWQIVWAGSQVQCFSGNSSRKNFTQSCQPSYRELRN